MKRNATSLLSAWFIYICNTTTCHAGILCTYLHVHVRAYIRICGSPRRRYATEFRVACGASFADHSSGIKYYAQLYIPPCTCSFTLTIPLAPAPCTTSTSTCSLRLIHDRRSARIHSCDQESQDICQFCAWDFDISFIGVGPPSAKHLSPPSLAKLPWWRHQS